MGLYLCKTAFENPGVSCIYIALTVDSAEKIMLKDIFRVIDKEFNLGVEISTTKRSITFPNGSVIYWTGADAKPDEMNKLLGQKFKLAVIDESSKYSINVHSLIYDILKPAMTDYGGTIALIGTATDFVNSFFAKVTMGKIRGWSIHNWSALDNPHISERFAEEIAEHRKNDPKVDTRPWFRQNYLHEWVVNTENLVYHSSERDVSDMPDLTGNSYYLGIVLNKDGHSAYSIVATNSKLREAYVVEAYKRPQTDLFVVLENAIRLQNQYDFTAVVCVDASEKLADEIRRRFPISVESVSEKDKYSLIQLFNAELARNNIKVNSGCTDILDEWMSVIWDDKTVRNVRREHPACANQVSSATLYAWSKCFNYGFTTEQTSDDPLEHYWTEIEDRLANPDNQDEI